MIAKCTLLLRPAHWPYRSRPQSCDEASAQSLGSRIERESINSSDTRGPHASVCLGFGRAGSWLPGHGDRWRFSFHRRPAGAAGLIKYGASARGSLVVGDAAAPTPPSARPNCSALLSDGHVGRRLCLCEPSCSDPSALAHGTPSARPHRGWRGLTEPFPATVATTTLSGMPESQSPPRFRSPG